MKLFPAIIAMLLLPALIARPAPEAPPLPPPIEPSLPAAPGNLSEPSLQTPATPGLPTSPTEDPEDWLKEGGAFRPLPQAEPVAPKAQTPKAGDVQVDFVGGTAFKPEEMRGAIADTLTDIRAQGLSNALADDAAFFLANFYRQHGYSKADVAWETLGANRLRLKINEGPLSRLGRVTIVGNQRISQAALLDYLLGPTHERFPHQQGASPFVEADIESGVDWVRAYCISQGFLNASVEPAKYSSPGAGGAVDVSVRVNEGVQYTFGKIDFSGEVLFSREELIKELEKARNKRVARVENAREKPRKPAGSALIGAPYSSQELGRLQQSLEYYYKTKGYFNASVESSADPAAAVKGKVAVSFRIQPGEQYRFDSITVAGLEKLKPDFLPKRFRSFPGQIYNPDRLQEKVQEMTRTGLFKSFRVREEEQADRTVRLDVTVEEAKAKELGFLLGYNTLEGGLVGASYRDRDLFGEGRPFTATAQYATTGLRGEVLYTDPWFFWDQLILRLRLYALSRDYDGYSKVEGGLRAEIAKKIKLLGGDGTNELEVSAFAQARRVNLQNVLITPDTDLSHYHGKERQQQLEIARQDLIGPTNYRIDNFGLSTNYDTRDSKINPNRGFFVTTTLDSAASVLGSSINFVRATGATSYYLPVGKTGLLAFGARAGIINPFKDRGSIPIDERFFNGGSLSVRSFTERHLGPKDKNGFPVGGDSFTVFNVEYDHPIRGQLAGAAFFDAGSLGTGNTFGEMRYGVGVGLRYRLPIGPLRLDYGFNPDRKADESTGAFHFSFGFAF